MVSNIRKPYKKDTNHHPKNDVQGDFEIFFIGFHNLLLVIE
jgi:hypothetical protein